MGIYFYKNVTAGGDWIIQETISNSAWVSTLLPSNAPLSTFRGITQSRASIDIRSPPDVTQVTALSCVFRAGRQGAATDHDSILFDVDFKSGLISGGTTNAHWYRLGLHDLADVLGDRTIIIRAIQMVTLQSREITFQISCRCSI